MKLRTIKTLCITLLVAFTGTQTLVRATDVSRYVIVKGQEYRQTNATTTLSLTNENPFRFSTFVEGTDSNSVLAATLTASKKVLTLTNEDGDFNYEQGFSTKKLLDAGYKAGSYIFTISSLMDGTNKPVLAVAKDNYPPVPTIANWAELQEVEPEQALPISWGVFTNGLTNDFIMVEISDTNDDSTIASTPALLTPGALNGTNIIAEIPADTLDYSNTYQGSLLFFKRTTLATTAYPGALGAAGFYRQTRFPLVTLPPPPSHGRIQFSTRQFSVAENAGTANITITRSGSEGEAKVDVFTSGGTATSGDDYDGFLTTLTFHHGDTAATVPVTINDDSLLEGNETVGLWLTNATDGAVIGNRSTATLTIVDNEIAAAGKFQFSATNYPVLEAGKTPVIAVVTVNRVGGSTGTATVDFITQEATATGGLDYVTTSGTLVFADKVTSKTISIPIINDSLDETNEQFHVKLTAVSNGAAFGTNINATVTITDDDSGGVFAFKPSTYTTNENSTNFTVTVVRSGGTASAVTVDFATHDGTATAGARYFATNGTLTFGSNELSKTFLVGITNNSLPDGNQSFTVQLSNATGGATISSTNTATLTINDDETSINISAPTVSVSEAGTNVVITLTRSGALNATATVSFETVNGTATAGSDYGATNGTLTFAANVSSKTITIPIVNDAVIEGNETFSFRIFNPGSGVLLGLTTNEVVTITNDDFAGTVQFSSTTYSGTEGSNAVITITRTGGAASGQFVYFQILPVSAIPGVDYTNVTGYVVFAAGETNKTVLVPIILDSLNESTETVTLSLSILGGGGGLALGSPNVATLSLNNKPDPNAVPLTGPVFIKGTIGSVAFNSLASACIATSSGAFQLTPTWINGSGLSSVINQMTVEGSRNLGTFTFNNNNGQATYSQTPTGNPLGLRSWVVGNGTGFDGTHGTFTLDAIDNTLKLASGRFTLHMQEDTNSGPGGFIDVTGSFRVSLQ